MQCVLSMERLCVAQEFEWSMQPVRFVLSHGCVEEAVEAEAGRSGHRHHGQCAERTKMIVSDVLTAANEDIRRMTVQKNVAADAGRYQGRGHVKENAA